MNVTLRTYVDVKPVVTIVVGMDLHAMGEGYYLKWLLLHIMLYFKEATCTIRGGLLNKGAIYLRKYGSCYLQFFTRVQLHGQLLLKTQWEPGLND